VRGGEGGSPLLRICGGGGAREIKRARSGRAEVIPDVGQFRERIRGWLRAGWSRAEFNADVRRNEITRGRGDRKETVSQSHRELRVHCCNVRRRRRRRQKPLTPDETIIAQFVKLRRAAARGGAGAGGIMYSRRTGGNL